MKITKNGTYVGYARILSAFLALHLLSIGSFSCASGGFKTTRAYAKFINSQGILLRIILYVFIGFIFIFTELLDLIIFNTMDFWSGTVSARNDTFEKDGMKVEVAHSRNPLRKSVFTISSRNGDRNVLELRETPQSSVEIYLNGVKRGEASNINDAMSGLKLFAADGVTPTSVKEFSVKDFTDIQSLPVDQGVQQTLARLGIASPQRMVCER